MNAPDPAPLDAGEFGAWLRGLQAALRGEADSDVPCGECTACCRSAQFIHIAPTERDALAHLPKAVLFPAPRRPRGHVLMGYDADGRCPMLQPTGCTVYAHRPRTCRVYDCRVFAAAGITADDDKPAIGAQAARWAFSYAGDESRAQHAAVRAAARWIDQHRTELGPERAPVTATELAVMAVQVHEQFLHGRAPAGVDDLRT